MLVDYRFFTQLFWAGFNIFASVIIFISNGSIFFININFKKEEKKMRLKTNYRSCSFKIV